MKNYDTSLSIALTLEPEASADSLSFTKLNVNLDLLRFRPDPTTAPDSLAEAQIRR